MKDLVFLDLETTGLDPDVHEILEVGAIRVTPELVLPRRGRVVADMLVRPEHIETASPQALEVNGYTEDEWADGAVGLREALEYLAPMLDGAIPAGHHVAFDLAFLTRAYANEGLPPPAMDYHRVDTATLSWLLAAAGGWDLDSMSLDPVCAALGIERPTPHRAYADACASLEVARRVRDLVGASSAAFRAITQLGQQ